MITLAYIFTEILLHSAGSKSIIQSGSVTNEKLRCGGIFGSFVSRRAGAVEACGFWPGLRGGGPAVKRLVLVHPQRVKAIASRS